ISPLGHMCHMQYSCTLAEDSGFFSAYPIAHEIMHSVKATKTLICDTKHVEYRLCYNEKRLVNCCVDLNKPNRFWMHVLQFATALPAVMKLQMLGVSRPNV
ncbi:hypothetical protein X801_07007, partial [Opisthorchis viverrini]